MTTAYRAEREFADLAELPRATLEGFKERYARRSWALRHIRLPKGGRLDFERHPYQIKVYDDLVAESCALKGAQLGFSTQAISKALWIAVELGRNDIYTMPTDEDVSSFTGARINPIIRSSAYLSDRILKIDNVGQKQFSPHSASEREQMELRAQVAVARGDLAGAERIRSAISIATIYFKGTGLGTMTSRARKGEREAMAADADALQHDELDRSEPRTLDQYGARIDHSDLRWRDTLSTPRFPNGPIDREWRRSDQHVWMVRCTGCGARFELRFPGQPVQPGEERYYNIEPEPERWEPGMAARFMCHRCKKTVTDLDRLAGQWVPLRPERGLIRGYRISQMSYVGKSAEDIMLAHARYQDETDFWNLVMAVPFAGLSDNLSVEMIDAGQVPPLGGWQMSYIPDPAATHTMGVDVGARLHVVIRRAHPLLAGRRATVWLEEVTAGARDPEGWARLSALMYHFNVGTCVIDAHPEDSLAKAWADQHRGRVFRAYGDMRPGSQQGHIVFDPKPNEYDGEYTVRFQRTAVLDMARDRFAKGGIGMPRDNDIVKVFKEQVSAVFRVAIHAQGSLGTDTPLITGYEWVANGADHFRMADAYELLASMRLNPLQTAGPGATTAILGIRSKEPR